MGRKRRMKPERLAEKLLRIRIAFGFSQPELLRRLGFEEVIDYRRISEFELGEAEPPLPVLLQYARIAGVNMEDIVDDELDLPAKLPGNVRQKGLKRKPISRKRKQ
jgi:transcriptional regulator with XRE-family HTH domain